MEFAPSTGVNGAVGCTFYLPVLSEGITEACVCVGGGANVSLLILCMLIQSFLRLYGLNGILIPPAFYSMLK